MVYQGAKHMLGPTKIKAHWPGSPVAATHTGPDRGANSCADICTNGRPDACTYNRADVSADASADAHADASANSRAHPCADIRADAVADADSQYHQSPCTKLLLCPCSTDLDSVNGLRTS